MKDCERASSNIIYDLDILRTRFGNPIDYQLLSSQMRKDLSPYVGSRTTIDDVIDTGTHYWEYAIFLKIKEDKDTFTVFNELYRIFKDAQLKNPKQFKESFRHYWHIEHQAIGGYIDHFYLEREKSETPDTLSAKIAFQEIGMSLEGHIQPFARHFLMLSMLSERHKNVSFSEVDNLSFGQIIHRLQQNQKLKTVYSPQPWNLTISQWRNIAQHLSFRYDTISQSIICTYGKAPKIRELKISYKEIHDLCKTINYIFVIHKTAYCIFTLGISDIVGDLAKTVVISKDGIAAVIVEILLSHSIRLLSFDWQTNPWKLVATDPLNRSEKLLKPIFNKAGRIALIYGDIEINFSVIEEGTGFIHNGMISKRLTANHSN